MPAEIRRTLLRVQTTIREGWKDVAMPIRPVAALAVVRHDAPGPDKGMLALGASVGGHPNHRIGDRSRDLRDMGRDVDNPAGV